MLISVLKVKIRFSDSGVSVEGSMVWTTTLAGVCF